MVYNGAYTSMPAHIAEDLGLYKKNGLAAQLVTVSSGPAGVAALLGGSLDFIEPPTDQVLENQAKGVDLKIVVGNETKNFYNLMVADSVKLPHAAEGYPNVMHDFKGLRVGVNAMGATTQIVMDMLLKGAGMKPSDITYVADGSATTALAAFQAKRIDAQMAFTPFPEIVEALGLGRSALDMSRGQGPALLQQLGGAFEGFSTKESFIQAHPAAVKGFIQAQSEAIAWMKDPANSQMLDQEVAKYVNIAIVPANKRQATTKLMNDDYRRYLGATVDPTAIKAWNAYAMQNKLIAKAIPASQVIYEGAPKP
ncbi:MAG: ABC transporter substrate-binding protein [Chloroflexota bacterium]